MSKAASAALPPWAVALNSSARRVRRRRSGESGAVSSVAWREAPSASLPGASASASSWRDQASITRWAWRLPTCVAISSRQARSFCRRRTSPPVSPSTQSASFASSSSVASSAGRSLRRQSPALECAGIGPAPDAANIEGAGRAEARGQVLRRLGVGHASQQALVHALRQRQRREGAARRAHPGIVGAHRLGQPAALQQGIDMARPFGAFAGAARLHQRLLGPGPQLAADQPLRAGEHQ